MTRRERPYLFYGVTRAICGECLHLCDAKEVIEDGKVYLQKRCMTHGVQKVILSDDVDYFKLCREVYLKPPEQPDNYNTGVRYGCPYDCGICPDHEQHGCVSVLEVTDNCNLNCPTCFALSGTHRTTHRSMEQIHSMLDLIVHNEGTPDVVQVSGGEPTMHPQIFEILDECKRRPIQHVMLNTNGLRIAQEDGFAEKLAAYMPGFELYFQFDGLEDSIYRELRGANLWEIKKRALEKLDELNLSTTLVVTLKKGLNDDVIGDILKFAAQHRCIRGVTLQPVYDEGRNVDFDANEHRLPLSTVRRMVAEQSDVFTLEDVIPVPCHPDSVAMAYAVRGGEDGASLHPLTRFVPPELLLEGAKNTIIYEGDENLLNEFGKSLFKAFSTAHSPESASDALGELMCCLPKVEIADGLGYDRVFRLIIMSFIDRHTLDLRSVRKSCVHVAQRDGKRMIPFDTYNIFYREPEQRQRLEEIRAVIEGRRPAKKLAVVE